MHIENPHDFTSVDAAILAAMIAGPLTLPQIYAAARESVESIGQSNPDRLVDRRLIVMAESGRIISVDGGWMANPDAPVEIVAEVEETEVTPTEPEGAITDEATIVGTPPADPIAEPEAQQDDAGKSEA